MCYQRIKLHVCLTGIRLHCDLAIRKADTAGRFPLGCFKRKNSKLYLLVARYLSATLRDSFKRKL